MGCATLEPKLSARSGSRNESTTGASISSFLPDHGQPFRNPVREGLPTICPEPDSMLPINPVSELPSTRDLATAPPQARSTTPPVYSMKDCTCVRGREQTGSKERGGRELDPVRRPAFSSHLFSPVEWIPRLGPIRCHGFPSDPGHCFLNR